MSRNQPTARPQTVQPTEAYEPTLEEAVQAKVRRRPFLRSWTGTISDGLMQMISLRYVCFPSLPKTDSDVQLEGSGERERCFQTMS